MADRINQKILKILMLQRKWVELQSSMIKDQSFMREGIIWKLMFVKVAMISRSTRREACRQSCYPWQKLRQDQLQRCRSLADSSSHVFFVSHSWSLVVSLMFNHLFGPPRSDRVGGLLLVVFIRQTVVKYCSSLRGLQMIRLVAISVFSLSSQLQRLLESNGGCGGYLIWFKSY
uniref:Uncharacterized protein n=2 Tax=Musa acuminata subsp. malaccensis TaxID=214687 RepID=A0A804I2Y1_MUSAM